MQDFNSEQGLYSKGRVFCVTSLSDPNKRCQLLKTALALHQIARNAQPTATHDFIKELHDIGRLRRFYTQNIDCLEDAVGLLQADYVRLHGCLRNLVCDLCSCTSDWPGHEAAILREEQIPCPHCLAACEARVAAGKRKITIGHLRPAIIHSGEEHPEADDIASFVNRDQRTADLLLVLGTSLREHGPRALAKRLARSVSAKGGTVVYVDIAGNESKEWRMLVDYHVSLRCDVWVQDVRERLGAMGLYTASQVKRGIHCLGKADKYRVTKGTKARDGVNCVGSSFSNPIVID